MVTTSYPVGEIFVDAPVAASADDLLAWTELDIDTATAAVVNTSFYIGLFG